MPTMAVDAHWRCYVSPGFVARMSVEELARLWVHEVSHLLRDHHARAKRAASEGTGRGGAAPQHRRRLRDQRRHLRRRPASPQAHAAVAAAAQPADGGVPAQSRRCVRDRGAAALGWTAAAAPTGSAGRGNCPDAHVTASSATPSASGSPRGIKGRPGDARTAGGAGPTRRSRLRSPGGSCWARRSAPRQAGRPASARTTATAVPPGARRASPKRRPAEPAQDPAPGLRGDRHLGVGERRRTGQRAPGGWPRSRGRSAAGAIWCRWCPATRRPVSPSRCAGPRAWS